MNRRISWNSMALDEIELVYEKVEQNASISPLMEQLETQALVEAKNNVGLLKELGGPSLSSEQFDSLSNDDKESVISVLGNVGLSLFNAETQSSTIIIRLSPIITKIQACTVYNILNRIEKLDGSVTLTSPKWILKLQVPLGGKKGLLQWEMLIIQLYPWLSVNEESINELAVTDGQSLHIGNKKHSSPVGPDFRKLQAGGIRLPDSIKPISGRLYTEIESTLKSAGFTNVKSINLHDLSFFTAIRKNGKVNSITIDGNDISSVGQILMPGVAITISYHGR